MLLRAQVFLRDSRQHSSTSLVVWPMLRTRHGEGCKPPMDCSEENRRRPLSEPGGSFTEHWNGASWSVFNTPSGADLFAVTALRDGTVVAVGATCSASCSAVI